MGIRRPFNVWAEHFVQPSMSGAPHCARAGLTCYMPACATCRHPGANPGALCPIAPQRPSILSWGASPAVGIQGLGHDEHTTHR